MEQGGKIIKVKCLPSDAFAIALRAEVPIYISEEILASYGVKLSELGKNERE